MAEAAAAKNVSPFLYCIPEELFLNKRDPAPEALPLQGYPYSHAWNALGGTISSSNKSRFNLRNHLKRKHNSCLKTWCSAVDEAGLWGRWAQQPAESDGGGNPPAAGVAGGEERAVDNPTDHVNGRLQDLGDMLDQHQETLATVSGQATAPTRMMDRITEQFEAVTAEKRRRQPYDYRGEEGSFTIPRKEDKSCESS